MYPRSFTRYVEEEVASQPTSLTKEQCARLTALRERFRSHPECIELGLDEDRLSFARWLLEHGKVHESV